MEVTGLFGVFDHKILVSKQSPVTIVAGPNGAGKTHILRLTRAVLALEFVEIMAIPFGTVVLVYAHGGKLIVRRRVDEDNTILQVEAIDSNSTRMGCLERSSVDSYDHRDSLLPDHIRQLPDGRWRDEKFGRIVPQGIIERRYGKSKTGSDRGNVVDAEPWLRPYIPTALPIFIDTRRLDTASDGGVERARPSNGRVQTNRISEYIEHVRIQISEARRESLLRSQSADERFASKLLRRSRTTVKEESLKLKYQKLVQLHAELNKSGLTGQVVDIDFPRGGTNPTERRILNVFIEDWQSKMEPLIPVNQRLQLLMRIVNDKFTKKTMRIDEKGNIEFVSDGGDPVSVDQLSSGEQHLLALFTMLLFSAEVGSIVFVDEPEISLHAAWKHEFIKDIEAVAELSKHTVILATHSTSIVNGRWELVQDLSGEME